MSTTVPSGAAVVGGGAGLPAAVFTARHGLDTLVPGSDEPILRRNATLENSPGFTAGVNVRRLLDPLGEPAENAGSRRRGAIVTRIAGSGDDVL